VEDRESGRAESWENKEEWGGQRAIPVLITIQQ
jgi:hypothetical protein